MQDERRRVRLPWPVTMNSMYRSIKGRNILSRRAREYKKICTIILGEPPSSPYPGEIGMILLMHPPKNFRYDVDNYFKMILDCLRGYWYSDDSQIQVLMGVKRLKDPAKEGFVNILIER